MFNSLKSPKQKQKKSQRGRGIGSGLGGHTAGRGTKGQKSRSGYSRPRPGFEGGQMPLSRRLPKLKGFSRGEFTKNVKGFTINLSDIETMLGAGEVTIEKLVEAGLIRLSSKKMKFKVLFDQEIKAKLTLVGIPVSQKAREAIEKVGGSVQEYVS